MESLPESAGPTTSNSICLKQNFHVPLFILILGVFFGGGVNFQDLWSATLYGIIK